MTDEETLQRKIKIAEAVAALGLRGSDAEALRRLVPLDDPDPETSAFAQAAALGLLGHAPAKMRRTPGPANPVICTERASARRPAGFVSQEEYVATPPRVRLQPEFQDRVRRSRAYWPTHFSPRHDLPRAED